MNQDHTFRAVLIVVFLVVLPAGIYHRLKSQATREKLDRRQEGLFILVTLRPVGIALWLGLIIWMIDPDRMAWSSVPLPVWLKWIGVGVLVSACWLLVWTFRCLVKNLTDTVVTREKHVLVVHGPYRWVRHPFYDAAALLALASSLVAANWFSLVIVRMACDSLALLSKDDLVYGNEMCFQTFASPANLGDEILALVGSSYCDFCAALMVRKDEGLIEPYNHFHDPDEHAPERAFC